MDGVDDLERMTGEPNPYWNRARLEITWNLPVMTGMLDHENIIVEQMRQATRDELNLFHDYSFIETLELFGNMGTAFSSRFGLDTDDCPVFHQVDKYAGLPVGATVDATMGVVEGKYSSAMSYFGGMHHAKESKATGFCYYNDCAIAIKKYREKHPNKRVLYLDTDVHHGDGTQEAFYSDPNVLTISLHELSLGFFPGTGRPEELGIGEGKGYSVNIPFPPLTGDVEFWRAFEEVVVPLWHSYKPDLVFWDVGADAHMNDPLGDLMLTLDTYHRLSITVKQLVHLGSRKLVVTGGGGYDPVTAAKVWATLLADLADIALPPTLPVEWMELCKKYGFDVTRDGWTDVPTRTVDWHQPKIARAVDEAISKVKKLIFPIHGIES